MTNQPISIFNVRLPWRIREALEKDTAATGKSMNQIIVELLEAKYGEAGK
jgi:predicted HicB family RNase H-like nuclease